jgi:hypothetical protein
MSHGCARCHERRVEPSRAHDQVSGTVALVALELRDANQRARVQPFGGGP